MARRALGRSSTNQQPPRALMHDEHQQDEIVERGCEPNRFGPYAVIRESVVSGSEGDDVLALFRTDVSGDVTFPAFVERRRTPRFVAREHRLWVGWWVDKGRFHTVGSMLDNISQG